LQTSSDKYLSVTELKDVAPGKRDKFELRADSDGVNEAEKVWIKCQREFVLKAKMTEGMVSGKRRVDMGGNMGGNVEDEVKRKWVVLVGIHQEVMLMCSKEAQTWGAGRVVVSDSDRKDIKKARKEGRLAEAMLDRRAALKRLVLHICM
jgi:protein FRG1